MSFSAIKQQIETKVTEVVTTTLNGENVVDYVASEAKNMLKIGGSVADSAVAVINSLTGDGSTEKNTPSLMNSTGSVPGNLIPGTTPPPWSNELGKFSSFNCIFTIAVLGVDELNDPLSAGSYRNVGPKNIVCRSGGGIDKQQLAVEKDLGILTEYFIDNVEIDSVIEPGPSTRVTNANSIKFTITEPYSLGQFIETCKVQSKLLGYADHKEAPYLMVIDFVGHDDQNNTGIDEISRRMIPFKFTDIRFVVTASGSEYQCEAVPYNEIALRDATQQIRSDISISGRTVSEILQSGLNSLMTEVNTKEIEKERIGTVNKADEYVIIFPHPDKTNENIGLGNLTPEEGATVADEPAGIQDDAILYSSIRGSEAEFDPNASVSDNVVRPESFESFKAGQLGKIQARSKLGETIRAFSEQNSNINFIGQQQITTDWIQSGEHPMGVSGFAYNTATNTYSRGSVELQLKDDLRKFKFKSGVKIQEVIEEVILASTYAQKLVDQLKDIPADGMIKWFKIETQAFVLQDKENIKKVGYNPKIYVFRVVEYKVHHSVFKAPSGPSNLSEIKKQCAKQYQYIYTGQNSEILDFDINFDFAFFTPVPEDMGEGTKREGASNKAIQPEFGEVYTTAGEDADDNDPAEGVTPTGPSVAPSSGTKGGASNDNTATSIARAFNDALMSGNTTDLLMVDLTVQGDPFYLSDSGMGNYTSGDTSYTNMNRDGSMNYQNGQVHINLIFRTPVDYNVDGVMDFPSSEIVNSFSGVFKVIEALHTFEGNVYKTRLKLNRVRGQEEGTPVSLIKTGDPNNSSQSTVPGNPSDVDRNAQSNSAEAVQAILNLLPGGTIAQLAEAAESKIRELIGGLDPLAATKDQLAAALGIDPNLIPDDVDEILNGNFDPGSLLGGAAQDLIGQAVVLDPSDLLAGFADQAVQDAEAAAQDALNNVGNNLGI